MFGQPWRAEAGGDSGTLHPGPWAGQDRRCRQTPCAGPAGRPRAPPEPAPPPAGGAEGGASRAPHGLSSSPGTMGGSSLRPTPASQAPGAVSGPPRVRVGPAQGVEFGSWALPSCLAGERTTDSLPPALGVPGASKVPVALPGDSVAASSTRGLCDGDVSDRPHCVQARRPGGGA